MESKSLKQACISSVPNLRLLCSSTALSGVGIYRSSKPDRLTCEDLPGFQNLGIKYIIDFRSKEEYFSSDGQKLLDKDYLLYKVTPAKKAGQTFTTERIDDCKSDHSCTRKEEVLASSDGAKAKHFLINFFTPSYILRSVSRLPCYLYCVGIFHFLCDLFIRRDSTFKRFGRFFTQNVINRVGIKGQYIDITEFCQPALCTALKLIADLHHSSILLNCAHGKDRTGIVSALVLTCLGLPKAYIIKEYALSEEGLQPVDHLVRRDLIEKYGLKNEFVTASVDTMSVLFDHLENKYGSVENYMNAIGFSHEEQMSLRRLYSLPDPASVLSELSSTDASNIPRKEKLPFLRKRGKEITSPAISSKETEL